MRPFSFANLLIAACVAVCCDVPHAHAFEAGAAKTDITPPLGTPLLGVPERMGRGATSVHSPLYARALYLNDGETAVMLVTADLYEIPAALRSRVLELAPESIAPENIVLAATGTHSGPGGMERGLSGRQRAGRYIPELVEATASGIAESMRLALAARQRGAIGHAVASQSTLSKNTTGSDAPIDEQVGVVRVDDADGNAIAIVANFGVRADIAAGLAPYAFSSDFPGLFCDELDKLTPMGCIALFLNGASADQVLANPEDLAGWEQAVSVAKLLAIFVKGVANQIAGAEATLALHQSEVTTPPVLSPGSVPRSAPLQHVEIGDALLSFLPGVPSARLVIELRARSLARGYAAHFIAGPANANVGGLVTRADFADLNAPAFKHPLGPGAGGWMVTEVEALMTRGEPSFPAPAVPRVETTNIPGGTHVRVSGDDRTMGLGWGRAFQGYIENVYAENVTVPLAGGRITPDARDQGWWPAFLDSTRLFLPALAARARTGLRALPAGGQDFVEGTAAGAGLPFDAVWLSWNAPLLFPDALRVNAPCTPVSFAVLGDAAGADGVLVAQSVSGITPATLVAATFRPDAGLPVLQITEAGGAAFYAGVNGAGVALCVDRFPGGNAGNGGRQMLGMRLRALLHETATFASALAALRGVSGVRGYRFLVTGPDTDGFAAAYVDIGEDTRVTRGSAGLVLSGTASESMEARDPDTAARVTAALGGERIVDVSELKTLLTGGNDVQGGLWNGESLYALVIAPKQGEMHVAFRAPDDGPPVYATLSLEGAPVRE